MPTPAQAPRDLWAVVAAFELDDPRASLPFSRRLQREQFGWGRDVTQRAIEEYKRFFCLAASSGVEVTPSETVDQVWHLHLVYTRSYQELCRLAGVGFLHHGPTKGGESEGARFREQYEETLALYRKEFGAPPEDIWPPTEERFKDAGAGRWVDTAQCLVLRRRTLYAAGWACVAAGSACWAWIS